jgi:hypothetical protein
VEEVVGQLKNVEDVCAVELGVSAMELVSALVVKNFCGQFGKSGSETYAKRSLYQRKIY